MAIRDRVKRLLGRTARNPEIPRFPDPRQRKVNESLLDALRSALAAQTREPCGAEDESTIRSVFSWTAKWYAPPFEKVLDALVASQLVRSRLRGGLVLDVGCGAGRMGDILFKGFPAGAVQVDGLDKEVEVESSLRRFVEYPWSRNAVHADFSLTGLQERTYDLIFSNNAIHICQDRKKAFAEMARIAKPGGILLFNCYTPEKAAALDATKARLREFDMGQFAGSIHSGILSHYYDPASTAALLGDCGWEELQCHRYLNGTYADLYHLHYLPYNLYWAYGTGQSPLPDGYAVFVEEIQSLMLEYLLREAPQQCRRAMTDAREGCKMYVIARKR
jgi:SAM-dependent methyltransferase